MVLAVEIYVGCSFCVLEVWHKYFMGTREVNEFFLECLQTLQKYKLKLCVP